MTNTVSTCNFAGKIRSISNSTGLPLEPSMKEKIKFSIAILAGLTAGGYVGYSFIKDNPVNENTDWSLTLPVTVLSGIVGANIGIATFLGKTSAIIPAISLAMIALPIFTTPEKKPLDTQKLVLTKELDSIENKQRDLSLREHAIRKELLALSSKIE